MPRPIVAWTSVTLDGYTSGPDGPTGDAWLYEHAGQPATAEYFEGIWRGADTSCSAAPTTRASTPSGPP